VKTPTCLLVAAPDSTPNAKIKVYIFVHNFAVMLTDFQTVFSDVLSNEFTQNPGLKIETERHVRSTSYFKKVMTFFYFE